ncbi:MAG: hypothetical protein M3256_16145 [Actinomycetota bacterium]|nr:hypothetical protein [Actinomycetota bacterium]
MTKDWYDVAYVLLHNDDGGPEVAARRVVVRFGDMLVGSTETALTELSTNFTDADSQGSVAYATTMSGMHTDLDINVLANDAVAAVAMFMGGLWTSG